jgi:glyoxylase-like metal-dependent hydrolase (beta-lactamase superfamily II)
MIHEAFPVGPLQCNCSIIGDEASREAMVVDPGDDIDEVLAVIARHGLKVTRIYITHAHIDHIGGAMKLKAATGAPVTMHGADEMQLPLLDMQAQWVGMSAPGKVRIDEFAKDAHSYRTGDIEARVLYTPGHTEGSSCLYFPGDAKLIAGDTLFAGSIGRTDLPGGDFKKIMRSLHTTLMDLPDETLVTPGHGPETTIGAERETNPFLTDDRFKPRVQED